MVRQGDVRERGTEAHVVAVDAVTLGQRGDEVTTLRRTFHRLHGDVDDIILEPTTVGEPGEVAAEDTETVRPGARRHSHVESQLFSRDERTRPDVLVEQLRVQVG